MTGFCPRSRSLCLLRSAGCGLLPAFPFALFAVERRGRTFACVPVQELLPGDPELPNVPPPVADQAVRTRDRSDPPAQAVGGATRHPQEAGPVQRVERACGADGGSIPGAVRSSVGGELHVVGVQLPAAGAARCCTMEAIAFIDVVTFRRVYNASRAQSRRTCSIMTSRHHQAGLSSPWMRRTASIATR